MTTQNSATYQHTYHAVHLTEDANRKIVWNVIAEYLSAYVAPNAQVLELGAGYCYWINQIRATKKVAVDLWEEMPKYAATDVTPLLFDLSQGLTPLGEQKFDVTLASNLLEHFPVAEVAKLVADVREHLTPSGRLIIVQPNFRYAYRHYFDDYTHASIFTDVSLPNLLRSQGFQIERVDGRFMPYSLRESRLPIQPWLIRAYLHSPFKPFAGQMLIVAQRK